jgi:hypothetical protein
VPDNTIRGWADDVHRFADDWPAQGARLVDDSIRRRLNADAGDGGLSHGRNMGRATTRINVRDGDAEVVADGSRRVWGILEGGTSAHVVRAAPGRMLRTPFGPRPSVRVSGVRARRTFSEGADDGLARAEQDASSAWSRIGG